MPLNKEQLKQMLDKNEIPYDEETTVVQMEELLLNRPGQVGDENKQDDDNSSPPARVGITDKNAEKEETFDPVPPMQEQGDGKPPIPIGRDAGGTARTGEVAPVQDITKLYNKDALRMKKHLAMQLKVRFMIPLSSGEKEGAYETWCGNGYKLTIKKGIMVDLPEQVANDLADHYAINMNAGREYKIDGDTKKENALL